MENRDYGQNAVEQFRDKIVKLVDKVYPKFAVRNKNQLACDFFVNGFPDNAKSHLIKTTESRP